MANEHQPGRKREKEKDRRDREARDRKYASSAPRARPQHDSTGKREASALPLPTLPGIVVGRPIIRLTPGMERFKSFLSEAEEQNTLAVWLTTDQDIIRVNPGERTRQDVEVEVEKKLADDMYQREMLIQFGHATIRGAQRGEEGLRFVGMLLKLDPSNRQNMDQQRSGVLRIHGKNTGSIDYLAVLAVTQYQDRAIDLRHSFRELKKDVVRQREGRPIVAVLGGAVIL